MAQNGLGRTALPYPADGELTRAHQLDARAGFRSITVINLHGCLDGLETEHGHFEQLDFAPTPFCSNTHEAARSQGRLLAKFFFVLDPDGYNIEVIHHHGRYWI